MSVSNWSYKKNSDDFGVAVRSLLLPRPLVDDGTHVHANLFSLGKELGIETITSRIPYYARDIKTRTPSGTVLGSTNADKAIQKLATEMCWNREKFLRNNCAGTATKHPCFAKKFQGVGIDQEAYKLVAEGLIPKPGDKAPKAPIPYKLSRGYLEGGNIIVASNREGRIKVLIGADTTNLTHLILRKMKFFDSSNGSSSSSTPTIANRVEQLAPPLSEKETFAIGREMHAMGLIAESELEEKEKLAKTVKEYVGQKEFVRQVLWPQEFGVAPEDIVEVPQAAYHLDVFIKTAPKGALFVQDFGKTLELLNGIRDARILSKKELPILRSYIDETTLLQRDLQPIHERVNACLQKAGFTVIGAPGTFYGADGGNRVDLNFLNGISGWSEKKKSYYYICLGAKVGEQLGKELMKGYEKFLQLHQANLLTCFIGHNPKNPTDFSDAMNFSIETSGLRCLTYELETEEHNDTV